MPVSMICSSFILSNLGRDMFTIKTGNHSSHPQHDLWHRSTPLFYVCNLCGHSGFGPRFSCSQGCNFRVHEECCTNFTYHTAFNFPSFLAGSNFVISRDPPQNLPCTACQLPIEGRYYQCNNRRTNLHLLCVRLPTTLTISGMQTTVRNRCNVRCSYRSCPNINGGWSYVSHDATNYHVACWKAMMLRPDNEPQIYEPQAFWNKIPRSIIDRNN
ncbi:hypothetical protein ES319_A10G236700v1 [Gossypium barbadense]|uniref:DC1 domain-containing protein n=1 Tax=Gossypium barbadense TaxID=3634 RepID=A0A5J5U896_GOSBA|nr:hypothetical protein ES319_A10G236700v1 [Gossypium barbadense]